MVRVGESRNWNLYSDETTVETITVEAHRYELSASAFLRVIARILREPADQTLDNLRERVRVIVQEEGRKV